MDDRTRFLIYTQGRTGSTLLCSLLDSHPGIRCQLEILNDRVADVQSLIDHRSAAADPLAYGFKVKAQQLQAVQRVEPAEFLQTVHADGWQIIHLRRRNIFRLTLSNFILNARKQQGKGAFSRRPADFIARIYVDPAELLQRIKFRHANELAETASLSDLPYFALSYEDIATAQARPAALNGVFQFLGLPDHAASTEFHKVTPEDWRASVTNPAEILDALTDTPFQEMAA